MKTRAVRNSLQTDIVFNKEFLFVLFSDPFKLYGKWNKTQNHAGDTL